MGVTRVQDRPARVRTGEHTPSPERVKVGTRPEWEGKSNFEIQAMNAQEDWLAYWSNPVAYTVERSLVLATLPFYAMFGAYNFASS